MLPATIPQSGVPTEHALPGTAVRALAVDGDRLVLIVTAPDRGPEVVEADLAIDALPGAAAYVPIGSWLGALAVMTPLVPSAGLMATRGTTRRRTQTPTTGR